MKTLLFLLTVPALLLVAACGDGDEEEDTGTTPTSTTTPARTTAAATSSPDSLDDVCAENPDPATADLTLVEEPAEGEEVFSPVTVRGRIIAFEAVFKITIYDEDGDLIAEQRSMTAEGTTLAPFEEEVPFSVDEESPACIWVYGVSGRDGSPDNVVQVPVILLP
jgi:Immunoglobulin-like domain of bacterial spore germination